MRNIKLTIEYDGTNYSGWQYQDNAISIQEKITEAIEITTGEKVKLIGSGRTDAKVHALGQVANFYTNSTIPGDRFKYALNIVLPDDIKIIESEEVGLNFHARFSALRKRYKYIIYLGEIPRPIYRNFSYHVKYTLNIDEIRDALKYFVGTHDFCAFMATNSIVNSSVRTIYDISIAEKNDFLEITIEGNSFLRNMIRIIVGTLIEVGRGRIRKEEIPSIIKSKNRDLAGPTAPPQGLFLEKVYYH